MGKVKKYNIYEDGMGSACFEHWLLKQENVHCGWVKWIKPWKENSDQIFQLKKTPFSDQLGTDFNYVVPGDIANRMGRNPGLIEIDIEGQPKRIVRNDNALRYDMYYRVNNYKHIPIEKILKPYLSQDEFLYRIAQSWKNIDNNKDFKKQLAYNMLSCQNDYWGTGGIGAESFVEVGGRSMMKHLKTSISNLFPASFLRRNNTYEYDFIEEEKDSQRVMTNVISPNSNEISFNDMGTLNPLLKVQIPLILPLEASYISMEWYDTDVEDYLKTSLLINADIKEDEIPRFRKTAIKTNEYISNNYPDVSFMVDTESVVRTACAFRRLKLNTGPLTEEDLDDVNSWIIDSFESLNSLLEDLSIQGRAGRWDELDKMSFLNKHLTRDEKNVYKTMLIIYKEKNENDIQYITGDELQNHPTLKKMPPYLLEQSLKKLKNYKKIIETKPGKYLIVDHRDISNV